MSGKYQIRKMRRDGVTQRYWMNPSREHDDAVTAVIGGDLATADSRKEQKLARQLLQTPSVQESVYRSLVRKYEGTKSYDLKPMLFLQRYLLRGYPGDRVAARAIGDRTLRRECTNRSYLYDSGLYKSACAALDSRGRR
jgi:hypothetical protein